MKIRYFDRKTNQWVIEKTDIIYFNNVKKTVYFYTQKEDKTVDFLDIDFICKI